MSRNIFNTVKQTVVGSSNFDLSHDHKFTCDMGELIPFYLQEIVPGDNFSFKAETLMRFAPLIAPVMHRINVFQHFFFVPNRILWPNFEEFMSESKEGFEPPIPPLMMFGGPGTTAPWKNSDPGSLANYLGVPPYKSAANTVSVSVSLLPFAAYQCVYNEYYRDQNLIDPVDFSLVDGYQGADKEQELTTLRRRAWQHDYFTGALPFAQKGEDVTIPVGDFDDVPVYRDGVESPAVWTSDVLPDPAVHLHVTGKDKEGNENGYLYAETSSLAAGATTIRDLRRAFRLQEWLEKNARGGTRYIESILSHFGVKSSDARLNRPEYIGGNKSPVVISEVLQTSETADSPQGNMAGHAISADSGKRLSYRAEEHGWIIGIMSVMPVSAYNQGLPRHFTRFDKLDYYWPSFQHIGEQEVRNMEVWLNPDGETDNETIESTFGYVPRYAEYKYNPSRTSGDFLTSLKFWHLDRDFETRPQLNQSFIECDPGKRIFAVVDPDQDSLYVHAFLDVKARRKMAKYGVPNM